MDLLLLACRGQVVRVKAPWIKHYYNNNGQFYIIPNLETVELGGTTQKDSWDTGISEQVRTKPLPQKMHSHTARQWSVVEGYTTYLLSLCMRIVHKCPCPIARRLLMHTPLLLQFKFKDDDRRVKTLLDIHTRYLHFVRTDGLTLQGSCIVCLLQLVDQPVGVYVDSQAQASIIVAVTCLLHVLMPVGMIPGLINHCPGISRRRVSRPYTHVVRHLKAALVPDNTLLPW